MTVDEGVGCGPRPANWDEFRSIEARTVINLEEGWFEFFHDRVGEESRWCEKAGKTFVHIPLSDFLPPHTNQVHAFLSAIKNREPGSVYFHCLHGVDRTGYMRAAYRILIQKWDREKAIQEMLDLGFHKFPYAFWISSLRSLK